MDKPELTLVMTPPSDDDPGYVERLERAVVFKEAIEAGKMTKQVVENMVEFLADYIKGDRAEVIAALRQASKREFDRMLAAVSGASAQVPPEN